AMTKLLRSSTDQTVLRCAFSSSSLSNLLATIVRPKPSDDTAFSAPTTVSAMANSPKSSGTRSRARTTERTKRMASAISDDDTFQLRPARTLFASGNFVSISLVVVLAERVAVRRNGDIQSVIQAKAYNVGK